MQWVLRPLVIGLSSLAFGVTAYAETSSGSGIASTTETPTEGRLEPSSDMASAQPSSAATNSAEAAPETQCSPAILEHYALRRAFTLSLIEQRERQRFESDLSDYARRRAFTEQLVQRRAQLSESDRRQFDEQVERYARLHEFTLHLEDERDLREALEFARDLALQERKLAFTRQLVASRRSTGAADSSVSGVRPSEPLPQRLPQAGGAPPSSQPE
jgi:hypothetical protein